MIRSRIGAVALALTLVFGNAEPGFAQEVPKDTSTAEVARCVEAHDNARVLMLEEKWLEAREAMTRCENAVCPLAIRSDCGAWLDEVARILPTLLVVVERDDEGTASVALELDGRPLELPNPPRPIEVLPGTHLLRVSLVPYAPVERLIVLGKREKNHVVRVRFAREQPAPALAPPAPAPPPPAIARTGEPSRPIPTATYALAGGAVAAFAASGVLLGSALASRDEALDRCAPECAGNERSSIEARLLAADVFGGIGLVLGGLAVYTFVGRPSVGEPVSLAPKLELSTIGSKFALEGRF